jgi:hypothetical protein
MLLGAIADQLLGMTGALDRCLPESFGPASLAELEHLARRLVGLRWAT